ncbi:MAG: Ig-like domain repeat protein [Thermoleophilia bacterium]|nr:Ig-like domain repeat protein [Thermoleophilia bacterium]
MSCGAGAVADPAALGPFGAATGFVAGCVDPVTLERTDGAGTSPNVDTADPTVQAALSPGAPDGANGWYRSSPLVSYVCADGQSGVAGCPRQERLPDGAGPWVRTATDVAGRSGAVAVAARVDTVAPPAPAVSVPANGASYEIGVPRNAEFSCGPDGTSGVAQCSGSYAGGAGVGPGGRLDTGEPGNAGTLGPRTLTLFSVDGAGHRAERTVSYTVVDTTKPTAPVLANPAPDAVTSQRSPSFTWGAAQDSGAGMKEYRINIGGKTYALPASASMQPGFVIPDVLADGTYEWQVFAVDQAGNATASPKRRFRVDPNAVAPPVITQGPQGGAATANRTPTFAFSGLAGATFRWQTLDANDASVPGGSGSGGSPVTLPALADGTYSFALTQVNALGLPSEPAVALFRVDTVPPPAPRVTAAPTVTGDTQPSFAWAAGEQGGTFAWEVLNPAGSRVQGPATTPDTSVRLPSPLGGGAYQFRVRQTDGAGNAGPWSDAVAFTIVGPPAGGGSVGIGGRGLALPATKNAKRMFPKAGAKLLAAKVTLRWKATRGAKLYNVQVFRLKGTKYVKVLSAFPRAPRYKVPKAKLKAGQRYAWRVWPFMGRAKAYAKKPFGVSWFDTRRAR